MNKNLKVNEDELVPVYEKSQESKWHRGKIVELVNQIEDVWILQQIHRCIINITK